MRRFRLTRASVEDAGWMADRLALEGRRFGTRVAREGRRLTLVWG